jgi:hypothetical protein
MATCLVLIRTVHSGMTPELTSRSRMLLDYVVRPIAEAHGFDVVSVDPHQYGRNDKELFLMIQSADVMVVDASAKSGDYQYSLGVRHALTDKPTIIFVTGYPPFDVHIPLGIIYVGEKEEPPFEARREFDNAFREIVTVGQRSFSPIKPALENVPRVFLSYAHGDADSVLAIDQWLRSRGVRVDLDERDFVAGRDIREEIASVIQRAGKVVCFYSANSKDRYYPKLERRLVEEVEARSHDGGKARNVLMFFGLTIRLYQRNHHIA